MDLNQLNNQVNQSLNEFNRKINAFFSFISYKLKNFNNLTLGEQISYAVVGLGIILVLTSVILFIF